MDIEHIAAQLEALGHPTRLSIFRLLVRAGQSGLAVGQLQDRLDIAASTLSHHLSKLVVIGLVAQERRGTTLLCSVNFDAMRELVSVLADECCRDEDVRGQERTACGAEVTPA
ncbi:MAG: ArsR/SmtB family transcription factor [Hyphomicrobiaceae bacterium]